MVKKVAKTQQAQEQKAQADAKAEEVKKQQQAKAQQAQQEEEGDKEQDEVEEQEEAEAQNKDQSFLDSMGEELLAKCEATGVKGIDWSSLLQEFGPILLQALLRVVQRNQVQGVRSVPEGEKLECSPEQLTCLDKAIDNAAECLVCLCEHRECCKVSG